MSSDSPAKCPYKTLGPEFYWKKSVAEIPFADLIPHVGGSFRLRPKDRIGTAGSCFAQHIARYLRNAGCQFLVTENLPQCIEPEVAQRFQYGLFSARYGNIYTARQLLQLIRRAYGRFTPTETAWLEVDGSWTDPFRPSVQPAGFRSREELLIDRSSHLKCVRRLFEHVDCFVFTLGLTECFMDSRDGAVFPVCPGCGHGIFNPDLYKFHNFTAAEVVADMRAFITELRQVNPAARVLLTVSPVPLIATMSGNHVLSATTYSKSVLRVAAEELVQSISGVGYFPSYEIITSIASRGHYFENDLRTVKEDGVAHVMTCFFRTLMPDAAGLAPARPMTGGRTHSGLEVSKRIADLVCDEESLVR